MFKFILCFVTYILYMWIEGVSINIKLIKKQTPSHKT